MAAPLATDRHPKRAFATFEPRGGRKQIPSRSGGEHTEVLVAKPLRFSTALPALEPATAPDPLDPEREAAKRTVYAMQEGDRAWGDVLAATLPTLDPDDCIRLVFLDGVDAREHLARGTGWLDECWISHSVVLFGDNRPVQLLRKKLPFITWMLRNDFLHTRASYVRNEDEADLEAFRQASASMPWAPQSLALPASSARRTSSHHEVDYYTFLDFLDYVLEKDNELHTRFEDVLLFSSVRLRGGIYEGGRRQEAERKSSVFEF